jgi:hypothetical protein
LHGAFDLAISIGKKEDSCYGEVEKKVEESGGVYESKTFYLSGGQRMG